MLSEKYIVSSEGELVEMGDGTEPVWGFSVDGFAEDRYHQVFPVYHFPRQWKNIDDYVNGVRQHF